MSDDLDFCVHPDELGAYLKGDGCDTCVYTSLRDVFNSPDLSGTAGTMNLDPTLDTFLTPQQPEKYYTPYHHTPPQIVSPIMTHNNFASNEPQQRNLTPIVTLKLPKQFTPHRSNSPLVHRLSSISCLFVEGWVGNCEKRSKYLSSQKLEDVIIQLLDIRKIRRKKPEELKSIMKPILTPDQQVKVLEARRKMMRRTNKKLRPSHLPITPHIMSS
ncbi:hypothetical protein LOD99_3846 [Oopsacas minuta]|uniref:Uncharacterized protein n=1 Tax=Oopsacas minuta TaxID=111878 RepID=A0AAV7JWV0_9METZ|nr:hypothetical protein LOD99_3846 [Oopsacas minuta]